MNWASNSIGFGVGGRVEFDLAKVVPTVPGLGVEGSFDYFFPGSGYGASASYWEINANGLYSFSLPKSPITPYAGAGIGIDHSSVSVLGISASANSVGLNLLGGAKFANVGKVTPFAEVRIELHSGSAVVLTGGVLF